MYNRKERSGILVNERITYLADFNVDVADVREKILRFHLTIFCKTINVNKFCDFILLLLCV